MSCASRSVRTPKFFDLSVIKLVALNTNLLPSRPHTPTHPGPLIDSIKRSWLQSAQKSLVNIKQIISYPPKTYDFSFVLHKNIHSEPKFVTFVGYAI